MTQPGNSAVQVAGHPGGIVSLDDGRKVTKKTTKYEVEFYELIQKSNDPLVKRYASFMPIYYGGNVSEQSEDASVTIENLTHGFKRPNVLDVKLGQQLWDERASQEKRERMDANSKGTTSWTKGLRLTGWQVWDNETQRTVSTSKVFGKTITPDLLPVGVRLFFGSPASQDWESYQKVVEKEEEVPDKGPRALPKPAVVKVLKDVVLRKVEELEAIFSQLEITVRGGSILIIYEGDESALLELENSEDTTAASNLVKVKLIDFAHAALVPGKGPDQGVLLGVKTFKALTSELLDSLQGA